MSKLKYKNNILLNSLAWAWGITLFSVFLVYFGGAFVIFAPPFALYLLQIIIQILFAGGMLIAGSISDEYWRPASPLLFIATFVFNTVIGLFVASIRYLAKRQTQSRL